MALYLGHESAIRYWLAKSGSDALPEPVKSGCLDNAAASLAEARNALLPFDVSASQPLYVLLPNKACCHTSELVRPHIVSKKLPDGSFCRLTGGVYIASPELTFVLAAASRPLVEAVEIGCYLTGSFAISERGMGYAGERDPLVSCADLERYLDSMPNMRGVVAARRCLKYVIEGTASPMEVFLALMFRLPVRMGGWAMPPIEANRTVALDHRLKTIAGHDSLRGDLMIPSVGGDVEYDSDEYHTGRYRNDHTQARRNALEAMGIKTVSATWGQVRDAVRFDDFMWLVEKRFGLKHRTYSITQKSGQHDLHDFLIDTTRSKFKA